jgi:hypothetical protein
MKLFKNIENDKYVNEFFSLSKFLIDNYVKLFIE